ncbi:uncharacterized protein CDV56_106645 [Aspergillus thermomutatus]|uniref:Uncharacterized protein n=1 Tax=Aspergillus thermomutatus TaxID=41047 RepID=A0A397HDC0_ASPTH|nr:uncharacterized protein CDV56_106645 [Aspergillus thermomutatus]RHZ61141.1 hypothetical protein CDV56_106645 [Aspergillus thermomutatus]
MTSTSAPNHQHPPATSAPEFSNQTTHTSHVDSNTHLATSGYAPNDNQLAGLVEAATAAAGQDVSEWAAAAAVAAEAGAAGHQHHLDSYGPEIHIEDDGFGDGSFGSGMSAGRQLRGPVSALVNDQGQSSGLSRSVSKKRKRGEDALDPALTAAGGVGLPGGPQQSQQQQQHHLHPPSHHYDGDSLDIRAVPPQSLSDARAAGVHSAAALFRQPSSNKKHTRPPMSKLFASLELSPENFLHLQAAAKAYMLDPKHPERRDCVGQRGKGDTEMVKLRLWNCVRHFLEVEGNGERFFGENVVNEGMGPRAYVWPRDQQKIIALVIPLLRRMVTNERQRQYAVETRKGGGSEERRRRKTNESFQTFNNSASPPRFPSDGQLQMHPQHHMPEEYSSTQVPMPPPQPQGDSTSQNIELGLTDLLLDGYTHDWSAINKSYDMYNHDFELDNLWYLSGLQQPDWRGLVAAVDSHYQVVHDGDFKCPSPCEDENIRRIINANVTSDLRWRIGGNHNPTARDEFASSITRDVSRIIRDNLAAKQGVHSSTHDHDPMPQPQLFPPPQFPAMSGNANTNAHTSMSAPPNSVSLRINIMQQGKRSLPRLDIPAVQCPDLETLKQLISRRFAGQLPGLPSDSAMEATGGSWGSSLGWKFKAWLPDGLVAVQNDGDWTMAILSAGNVDWMDGDLKVLVELESP